MGFQPGIDVLGHQRIADAITSHLDVLGHGSVLALHGSWGRGKTDVLARVYRRFVERASTSGTPAPLRLDPWRYGQPDLIGPIVLALLKRIPPEGWKRDERLRQAARTLLRTGNAMLFKALSVIAPAPAGGILAASAQPVDDLLTSLFEGGRGETPVDPDPVEALAERFRDLVERYLALCGNAPGSLLICVDDLDRCLPDHQIAMLEAIHFLTSADAPCSFLIALDPLLVQQATAAHYGTDKFDSNKYLDKLFTLRISLPELPDEATVALVRSELTHPNSSTSTDLRAGLGVTIEQVEKAAGTIFRLPELKNPRMIHRICDRIRLLALANQARRDPNLIGEVRLYAVVIWCAVAERWPELRQILQDTRPEGWTNNLRIVCYSYGFDDGVSEATRVRVEDMAKKYSNVQSRLPGKSRQPDLGEFLYGLVLPVPGLTARLAAVDQAMTELGL